MSTSRARVETALNHREPDRVPLDLGGSVVSGMHVGSVYRLRQALKLDTPGTPVKVIEPYQMLGEIKPDLMGALGADVVPLAAPSTFFGFRNEDWKPWTLFDGTPVLVPAGFNTYPEANGDILMYAQGDKSSPASGRMPKDGFYLDAIIRQPPIDEANLKVEDNLEEFGPVSEEDLEYFRTESERLFEETDKAILANFGGTSFGDIALVPAPWLKNPRGIRDVEEWYVSTVGRTEHVRKIFEGQCAIALDNLPRLYEAVGNRATILFVSGTDFGMQTGPFISPRSYRDLYQPFHREINDWVHDNTPWKTFIHTCGSVRALLPDIIEAGFDITNPVQCSASDMQPEALKRDFGDRIVFWGAGVDTQKTLPFGTREQVSREVEERLRIFRSGGGYVFGAIHNVQARVPEENLLALFETVKRCNA